MNDEKSKKLPLDPAKTSPEAAKIEDVKIEPLSDADTDKVVGGYDGFCSMAYCSRAPEPE